VHLDQQIAQHLAAATVPVPEPGCRRSPPC